MAEKEGKNIERDTSREQPIVYVCAAGMVMCLLYLVAMSLLTLSANISDARAGYGYGVTYPAFEAPRSADGMPV